MPGSRSRNKGQAGEREFAAELTWLFNCEAHRGRQYHGGQDAPDIKCTIPGVHWEVKRCEALSLYKALEQAKADAEENVPVVAHRRNNKPWIVAVELKDLPKLVVQLYLELAGNA